MIPIAQTAALYARFSSDNQRTESIDAQVRAMRAYCKQHHLQIVETYIDEARSATTDRRPEFQRMISDSASHSFGIVLVHKLDRFARNRYDSAVYKRELKKNGVTVYSVLENLDNSPESVIMESVLEGMSEYYSQNLAREVMKGLKETALQCKHTGGKPPLGYDVDPVTKHLVINEAEAETVRIIFNMYAGGAGYTDILYALHYKNARTKSGGEFQKNSFVSILTNPKYKGTFVFNRSSSKNPDGTRNSHRYKTPENIIAIEGGCPQIVDEETFGRVAERMNSHKRDGGRLNAKHNYLLAGKVVCRECGRSMVGNARLAGRDRKLYITYRCPSQNRICRNREINKDYLEGYVIQLLEQEIFSKQAMRKIELHLQERRAMTQEDREQQLAVDEERLRQVSAELRNIADAIGQGLLSSILTERLMALEKEKAGLERCIARGNGQNMREETGPCPEDLLREYMDLRKAPSSMEYKRFIGSYIASIAVGNYVVEIRLRSGLGVDAELDRSVSVRREEIYGRGR